MRIPGSPTARRTVRWHGSAARFAAFFASSVLWALPAAQENGKPYTIHAMSELVVLDVGVRDAKGRFVTGLTKENFHVFEEGRKEPIVQFGRVDAPVTIGLVVDSSASMQSKRAEVVEAGLAFAKESNPQDEFFVVNFNDRVVHGLPDRIAFTDDVDRLRRALYYGPAHGRTALYDAIADALNHIQLGRHEKRTLIVVSDGGDNSSKLSRADLLQRIQKSIVTIYAIAVEDPDDTETNLHALHKITQASGGEFFLVSHLEEISPVFHRISEAIRSRYTVGYAPDPHLNRETEALRHVRVVASNGGGKLSVQTRTSYRLDSQDGSAARTKADAVSSREAR